METVVHELSETHPSLRDLGREVAPKDIKEANLEVEATQANLGMIVPLAEVAIRMPLGVRILRPKTIPPGTSIVPFVKVTSVGLIFVIVVTNVMA